MEERNERQPEPAVNWEDPEERVERSRTGLDMYYHIMVTANNSTYNIEYVMNDPTRNIEETYLASSMRWLSSEGFMTAAAALFDVESIGGACASAPSGEAGS